MNKMIICDRLELEPWNDEVFSREACIPNELKVGEAYQFRLPGHHVFPVNRLIDLVEVGKDTEEKVATVSIYSCTTYSVTGELTTTGCYRLAHSQPRRSLELPKLDF